jgi:tetratricopeptide (TPR) repeat protein
MYRDHRDRSRGRRAQRRPGHVERKRPRGPPLSSDAQCGDNVDLSHEDTIAAVGSTGSSAFDATLAAVDSSALDATLAAADSSALDATLAAADGQGSGSGMELPRGAVVGRHVVVGRLGVGGMGVVYAAHDPELDRKIALKLVLPGAGTDSEGRTRLLREAQALARLSHPNVVAVHDVGTHGERVWIAMEFVAGHTLNEWARLRPRGWSELLRVLLHAARGVAAAHAAGLVHRDLKPENMMIGDDGRVRVMDFGLAHGRLHAPALTAADTHHASAELPVLTQQLTYAGALQGTPAYMAPEQWEGAEVTAAADQFAWSVTAWELLHGERPFAGDSLAALAAAVCGGARRPPPPGRRAPKWLRRVVERGLAIQPAQRWTSMVALIAALERGRTGASVRKAAAVAVAVAGLVAGAVAHHRWEAARQLTACAAAGAELDELWSAGPRDRLHDVLLASGVANAAGTAERVLPWIDRHADAWRAARVDVCLADLDGRHDVDTGDRARWCLDDRRVELAELLHTLDRPGPQVVQEAVPAAAGLRSPATCRDEGSLRRQPAIPEGARVAVREVQAELSRAAARTLAGDHAGALTRVTEARQRADALGWPPLIAAARLREGALAATTGAYAAAEEALRAAYFTAVRADAWETAADAANALTLTVGYRLARHAEGRAWGDHAALAIERAGDPGRLREADRIEHLGIIDLGTGDLEAATLQLERALVLHRDTLGEDHPVVALTLNRLGATRLNVGDYAGARALLERSRAIRERVLGPDHPQLAGVLSNLANTHMLVGAAGDASPLFARALAIEERALGPDHPNVALDLHNLAEAHRMLNHPGEAMALLERALVIQERALGPDHPLVATTLGNLGRLKCSLGDRVAARPMLARSLAIREQVLGPDHPEVAQALSSLGDLDLSAGDIAAASPAYRRALDVSERALGPDHVDVAQALTRLADLELHQQRPRAAVPLLTRAIAIFDAHEGVQDDEAETHFRLARALHAEHGDPARARAQALLARDIVGPADPDKQAEIAAWLAAHDRAE